MDATILQLKTPKMERNEKTILLLRTELNGTERNKNGTIKKVERERKDLAKGPRSRTISKKLEPVVNLKSEETIFQHWYAELAQFEFKERK